MNADNDSTDRELVTRAREGDDAAFAALCGRYEARVAARVARRLTGRLRRKISVADVMQESLATASQKLPQFADRGEGAFGAWLGGIADHKVQEVQRKYTGASKRDVKREVSRGGLPETEGAAGQGPSASTVAMAGEQHEALAEAMGRLTDDHRRVLELLQIESHTTAETAELMERSPEAVRKLYARALANLADLLAEDERDHA